MKLGLFLGDFSGATDTEGVLRQLVSAEDDEFDCAWLGQVFTVDVLTTIAMAGRRTSRIEFGTSVIPVYLHHPFAMAQQALTVQAATEGRLSLGLGMSHAPVVEGMWGLSYDRPARYMREYLKVVTSLVREGRAAHQGEVFKVQGGVQVPGATPCPVLIAALAPMMLRIAGELADGTVTWMTGAKTIDAHIVPRMTKAAEAAGRPRPRVVVGLPVAVTDNPDGARERASKYFAIYGQLPNYRRMLDLEGAAGPADVAIVGDEESVAAQIKDYAFAGATDFAAAIFPADDPAPASIGRTRALLKSLVGKV
jgi:F420-dependent oxidoreductase-like protein